MAMSDDNLWNIKEEVKAYLWADHRLQMATEKYEEAMGEMYRFGSKRSAAFDKLLLTLRSNGVAPAELPFAIKVDGVTYLVSGSGTVVAEFIKGE